MAAQVVTVGQRLRELRMEAQMTLEQVAEAAGLSKAYVSQLENDKANPSLATLSAVTGVFGLSVAALFEKSTVEPEAVVVRKGRRTTFSLPGSEVNYEFLSPDTTRAMQFMLTVAEPGQGTGPELLRHRGEECGLVLRGRIRLWVGDVQYVLEEGDSYYLDSAVPHKWSNIGEGETEIIWVVSPPSY